MKFTAMSFTFLKKREFAFNVCTAVNITFRLCERAEGLCLLFLSLNISRGVPMKCVRVIDCIGLFHSFFKKKCHGGYECQHTLLFFIFITGYICEKS